MKNFNLSQLSFDNYHIIDSEPIIYRWGGGFNYSDLLIVLNDYIVLNLNLLFLKLKKIILILLKISYRKGICLFFFLDFYKRFYLKDLIYPDLKNFYIIFINKTYAFLTRFKYFVTRYKDFKFYSNYINPKFGSFRYPTIVFLSKKCWKFYKNFFFTFVRLRLLSIKSNVVVGLKDNVGFNVLAASTQAGIIWSAYLSITKRVNNTGIK